MAAVVTGLSGCGPRPPGDPALAVQAFFDAWQRDDEATARRWLDPDGARHARDDCPHGLVTQCLSTVYGFRTGPLRGEFKSRSATVVGWPSILALRRNAVVRLRTVWRKVHLPEDVALCQDFAVSHTDTWRIHSFHIPESCS
jgi:hypothetical protein